MGSAAHCCADSVFYSGHPFDTAGHHSNGGTLENSSELSVICMRRATPLSSGPQALCKWSDKSQFGSQDGCCFHLPAPLVLVLAVACGSPEDPPPALLLLLPVERGAGAVECAPGWLATFPVLHVYSLGPSLPRPRAVRNDPS